MGSTLLRELYHILGGGIPGQAIDPLEDHIKWWRTLYTSSMKQCFRDQLKTVIVVIIFALLKAVKDS